MCKGAFKEGRGRELTTRAARALDFVLDLSSITDAVEGREFATRALGLGRAKAGFVGLAGLTIAATAGGWEDHGEVR